MAGLLIDVPATDAQHTATQAFSKVTAQRVAGEYGFWQLPEARDWQHVLVQGLAKRGASQPIRHVVVLGTGGSSLGCKALATALGAMGPLATGAAVRLSVCDNVDGPVFFAALTSHAAAETLVCAISKSGGTSETIAQLAVATQWLTRELGAAWRDNLVVITDPASGALRAFATAHALLALPLPANVGGRFSALSAVGLAPLAMVGMDIAAILSGAARATTASIADERVAHNPALALAAWLFEQDHAAKRNVVVMMMYSDLLQELGAWFAQLWAESLGKDGMGPTPLICRGTTDQHSLLQLFAQGPDDKAYIIVDVQASAGDAEPQLTMPAAMQPWWGKAPFADKSMKSLLEASRRGTMESLIAAGRPVATISLPSLAPDALGAFMMLWQAACAYAGAMAGINAFDQPGVEDAKQRTNAHLASGRQAAGARGARYEV